MPQGMAILLMSALLSKLCSCCFTFHFFLQNSPLLQSPSQGVILTNQSLVMQKIGRERSGGYTCQASNDVGKGSSQEIYLNVKCTPNLDDSY